MTNSLHVSILILSRAGDRIPLLSLNELWGKLRVTNIHDNFVSKPLPNPHWLTVFGNCFSLVKN